MEKYKILQSQYDKTVKFIKTQKGSGAKWYQKYKDDIQLKGNKLFYKEREIIPREKVNDVLRTELYKKNGDVPTSRDAGFHILKKRYVGCSRRLLMDFIRAQKPLGEVLAALPKPKRTSGEKLKGYVFETDLIFLRKPDLIAANRKFNRDNEIPHESYFITVVEKITGLTRMDYVTTKDSKIVTPKVIKLAKDIAKQIGVSLNQCEIRSDKGGEFSAKDLKKEFKKQVFIPMGPTCEKKNSSFQANFFKILRQRKATNIKDAMKQSEVLLNQTYNKNHKATPNEVAARKDKKQNLSEYNKSRKSFIAGDNRKDFEVGDYVRLLLKDKKALLGYKKYKNLTYGKEVYQITKVTKKAVPKKYRVNQKWYLQSDLLKSAPRDQKSLDLVKKRDQEFEEKRDKDMQEHIEKRREEEKKQEVVKKAGGRSVRHGARKAKRRTLKTVEEGHEIDNKLDDMEKEDLGEEVNKRKKAVNIKNLRETEIKKRQAIRQKKKDDKRKAKLQRLLKRRGKPHTGTLEVLEKRYNKLIKPQLIDLT